MKCGYVQALRCLIFSVHVSAKRKLRSHYLPQNACNQHLINSCCTVVYQLSKAKKSTRQEFICKHFFLLHVHVKTEIIMNNHNPDLHQLSHFTLFLVGIHQNINEKSLQLSVIKSYQLLNFY